MSARSGKSGNRQRGRTESARRRDRSVSKEPADAQVAVVATRLAGSAAEATAGVAVAEDAQRRKMNDLVSELREISGQVNRMMSQVDRAIDRLGVHTHAAEPLKR